MPSTLTKFSSPPSSRLLGCWNMSRALKKIPSNSSFVSDADSASCIVHALVPEWLFRNPSKTEALPVSGGTTNRVYHVRNTENGTTLHALVRIFGADGVISESARLQENKVYAQLAERLVAPALLGVFANGRVEQWLHARTISLPEMTRSAVMCGVAYAMARLHSVCIEEGQGPDGGPAIWTNIKDWIKCARRLRLTPEDVSVATLEKEVKEVRHVLESKYTPSDIVFAHNDLPAGNILVSLEDNETVHLIDFEYSGMAYRSFDIGNFFCEAMGGTADGFIDRTKYPTIEAQLRFCRTYLFELSARTGSPEKPSESAILNLAAEANQCGLLSHLYWTAWALAQSSGSTVDFPYLLFAKQRFEEYLRVKDQYLMPRTECADYISGPC